MSQFLGNNFRFKINTGTNAAPDWKAIAGAVSASMSDSNDKLEVANKDVGKKKKYLKTRLDQTMAISWQEDSSPAAGFIGYPEILEMQRETFSDASKGEYEMKLESFETGQLIQEFTGFFDGCELPTPDMGLVECSATIQVNSLPTTTATA